MARNWIMNIYLIKLSSLEKYVNDNIHIGIIVFFVVIHSKGHFPVFWSPLEITVHICRNQRPDGSYPSSEELF